MTNATLNAWRFAFRTRLAESLTPTLTLTPTRRAVRSFSREVGARRDVVRRRDGVREPESRRAHLHRRPSHRAAVARDARPRRLEDRRGTARAESPRRSTDRMSTFPAAMRGSGDRGASRASVHRERIDILAPGGDFASSRIALDDEHPQRRVRAALARPARRRRTDRRRVRARSLVRADIAGGAERQRAW